MEATGAGTNYFEISMKKVKSVAKMVTRCCKNDKLAIFVVQDKKRSFSKKI